MLTRYERPDLPELDAIERLVPLARRVGGEVEVLTRVAGLGWHLPIHAFRFGIADPTAPTLLVVGGVHGLERVGAEVAIAFLHNVIAQLDWDVAFGDAIARGRIVVVPLVNPVGMAARRRSNGNGVDLMRNAPEAPGTEGTPLVGGQRLSPRLPWYMGDLDAMEPEAAALVGLVERAVFRSRCAIAVDLHSGFGMTDRLWFPYARSRAALPHLPEVAALAGLVDHTLPDHVYRIEPSGSAYTIRGDLWDHLYDRHGAAGDGGVFLPFTLEMGSWLWVRKNPRQLLSRLGGFNPLAPHRLRRTRRRHLPLLHLLFRAAVSHASWVPSDDDRPDLLRAGLARWYR